MEHKHGMSEEELKKAFGNPGIMGYCTEKEYPGFIQQLEERGYFHDLERTGGVVLKTPFKTFEYKDSITESDFSHIPFKDEDEVVHVWCVEKRHQKT